jgi:hypothetical protein
MYRRTVFGLLAALAAGAAGGCGSSGGASGFAPCDDAGACPAGLACVDGVCRDGADAGSGGNGGSGGSPGDAAAGGAGISGAGGSGGTPPECPPGRTWCASGGDCIDLMSSSSHCGACDRACDASESCATGSCVPLPDNCSQTPCPVGFYCDRASEKCSPGCALDSECPQPGSCNPSTHACECAADHHFCSGECVSKFSVASCGSSCDACPEPPNGTASCDGTRCGVTCDPGFHACSDQCVSNTSTQSCGAACTPCPGAANASATCDGTACGISCDAGYADCDGLPNNGCERNTGTDPDHCGGCGRSCSGANLAVRACAGGACTGACQAGFADCDEDKRSNGCEVNTLADAANCGGCDVRCSTGQTCVDGRCVGCNKKVLVLGDRVTASNTAVGASLDDAGFITSVAHSGVALYAGTPAASSFDVVVAIVGDSWATDMPSAGQSALVQAQAAGTGVVLTEWASYHVASSRWLTLGSLTLISYRAGSNGAVATDYQLTSAGHPLWNGLPGSFTTTVGVHHARGVLTNGGTMIARCTACAGTGYSGAGVAVKDAGGGRIVHLAQAAGYESARWYDDANLLTLLTNSAKWAGRCR